MELVPENMEAQAEKARDVGHPRRASPILLFLALFLIYNLTLESPLTGDCMPNMYLPLSILRHGSISLSFFPELYAAGRPYYLVPFQGGLHSIFGIGAALFAVPFYLPLAFGNSSPSFITLIYLAKLVASFYAALSAALIYAALRRITSREWALTVALLYGLATPTFCTSSQALWQHPPSQFLLSLTIYFLVRGREERRFTALSGLPLGFAVLVRSTNMVFILPLLLYVAWEKRSELPGFVLCLLPAALATGLYNHVAYGAFYRFPVMAPKYLLPVEEFNMYNESGGYWRTSLPVGFLGNLVSPSRGLFFISPVLMLVLPGAWFLYRNRKKDGRAILLTCFLLAFLAQLLLVSKKTDWTGGLSFGNRLLVDTLPFLVFLLVPFLECLPRVPGGWKKWSFYGILGFLVLISVLLQIVGIFSYDRGSWECFHQPDLPMWSLGKSQPLFYLLRFDLVTPPIIKHLKNDPVKIRYFEVVVEGNDLLLRFRLSELSFLRWYVVPPEGERIHLFKFYGLKGMNEILVTEEDLASVACGYDSRYLWELIAGRGAMEVEASDPLTEVKNIYRLR